MRFGGVAKLLYREYPHSIRDVKMNIANNSAKITMTYFSKMSMATMYRFKKLVRT